VKIDTKTNAAKFFGLSGAASFLGCDGRTVRRYANGGRLPCTKDASGKRLFALSALIKFKRTHHIGNQGRPRNIAARSLCAQGVRQ